MPSMKKESTCQLSVRIRHCPSMKNLPKTFENDEDRKPYPNDGSPNNYDGTDEG